METPRTDRSLRAFLIILTAFAILAGIVFARVGAQWIVIILIVLLASLFGRMILGGVADVLRAKASRATSQPLQRVPHVRPPAAKLRIIHRREGNRARVIL